MKKTIEISLKDAIDLYNESSSTVLKNILEDSFGKDFAQKKEIYDRVYTIATLQNELGSDPRIYHIVLAKDKYKRFINACSVLLAVATIYNEDKKLSLDSPNYCPYMMYTPNNIEVRVDANLLISSIPLDLCYSTRELAQRSYDNFKEYWHDYFNI